MAGRGVGPSALSAAAELDIGVFRAPTLRNRVPGSEESRPESCLPLSPLRDSVQVWGRCQFVAAIYLIVNCFLNCLA